MPQSNYQEPIEKEDLDLKGKFKEAIPKKDPKIISGAEVPSEKTFEAGGIGEIPRVEMEGTGEKQELEESQKIESARKTITSQRTPSVSAVQEDAKEISGLADFEKKVEKLVELALQKGPEHSINVARHMDASDNFTLDELHDRMIEEELRRQLIDKGLLKEL